MISKKKERERERDWVSWQNKL